MGNTLFYWNNLGLNYQLSGTGENVWLAFHGFGQDHAAFEPVARIFPENSSIYSFDIFFHGKSTGNIDKPIDRDEWSAYIDEFLKSQKIGKFSLISFSIGCRLVLPLLEAFQSRIEKAIFIAPEGIRENIWYRLAVSPFFRGLFRHSVIKPGILLAIMRFFRKYSIVEKSVSGFAMNQIKTRRQRWRIYKTWTCFRKLKVNSSKLARIMNENAIEALIIVSSKDKIIAPESLFPFKYRLKSCRMLILDAPHHKLIEKSADAIRTIIFDKMDA